MVAESGYDPSTSGLWAQHASSAQLCTSSFYSSCYLQKKLKRALRKQVQKWTTTYQIGDYVNYKRDDDKRGKGPAKVLGVVVMLRHGSRQIKAHICRMQPFPGEINSEKQVISPSSHKNSPEEPVMQENSHLDDDDSENEEFDQEVLPPQGSEELTSEENPELPSTFSSEQKKIKANQKITFQHEGQPCTATVISRARKGTGRYAKWFNIQYKTPDSQAGKTGSIDLAAVENLQIIEENIPNQSKGNVMTVADKVTDEIFELQHDQFDTAKQAELQSWKDHNVYEVVPHTQQKCMSLRWVCSLKSTNDGSVKPKARLVARGFEEQTDNIEKESPTCAKDLLRVMTSIINQNKWELRSIDIKTAFLQGEAIDRNVCATTSRRQLS